MANPKIQLRHDTSTNWQTQNPVLLEGEVAIETDSNKVKIGNGTDNYNTLPYITDQTKIDLDYSNADYQPVSKAGDTMTGGLTILNEFAGIHLKCSDFTKGTNPSNNKYWEYRALDNNANPANWYTNRVGNLVTTVFTDGLVRTEMIAFKNDPNTAASSTIQADISPSGVASCYFPNTTCCDGQWQNVNIAVVNTPTSLNGSSSLPYTLNLPNDGRNYMVLLYAEGDTGKASGDILNIKIGSDISSPVTTARNKTRTTSTVSLGGSIYLPVSSSHKIYVSRATNWNGNLTGLVFVGYRRIGTNS